MLWAVHNVDLGTAVSGCSYYPCSAFGWHSSHVLLPTEFIILTWASQQRGHIGTQRKVRKKVSKSLGAFGFGLLLQEKTKLLYISEFKINSTQTQTPSALCVTSLGYADCPNPSLGIKFLIFFSSSQNGARASPEHS